MTRPTLFTRADNSHDSENYNNKDVYDILLDLPGQFEHQVMVSAVRVIYRTYNVDRIPKIVGFHWGPKPNKYGDTFFAEIIYAKSGYRALYGGKRTADGRYSWRCYMD